MLRYLYLDRYFRFNDLGQAEIARQTNIRPTTVGTFTTSIADNPWKKPDT